MVAGDFAAAPTFSIPSADRFTGVSSTIDITVTPSLAVPSGGKVVIEVLKSDVTVGSKDGFSNIAAPAVGGGVRPRRSVSERDGKVMSERGDLEGYMLSAEAAEEAVDISMVSQLLAVVVGD